MAEANQYRLLDRTRKRLAPSVAEAQGARLAEQAEASESVASESP
jgi:hypothetical protein